VTKLYKIDPSNPGKVKAVDIATGQQEASKDAAGKVTQWVEIVRGDVKARDQIVVTGQTKLVDGSPIVLSTEAPNPASMPAQTSASKPE
jgi:hypothetical protein